MVSVPPSKVGQVVAVVAAANSPELLGTGS